MTAWTVLSRTTTLPTRTTDAAGRWGARRSRRAHVVVLGSLALVAALLVAAVVLLLVDQHHESSVASARIDGEQASRDLVAQVLTYDARTIDADSARVKGLLTGSFRDDFGTLLDQVIVPRAREAHIATQATVTASSVVRAEPNEVTTLLFVNQQTTSTSSPTPAVSGSRVRATVVASDAGWKVSAIDPV